MVEVENKQNSIYLAHKNRQNEKIEQRNKKINNFTKVLTVVLSIFGILGIIESVWNLYHQEGTGEFALITAGIIVATVAVVFVIIRIVEAVVSKKGSKDDDERL